MKAQSLDSKHTVSQDLRIQLNKAATFRNHTSSWPFLNPVDRKAVPDYYEHVKFPMDMKTMAERLKANYYVNKRLFIADMKRMFTNCRFVFCKQCKY